MRIDDLYERIFSMSELAEIMPAVEQHLASMSHAWVTVDSTNTSVVVHTQFDQQPLAVTYQLRSRDPGEFRRLLTAALRSKNQGATTRQPVTTVINNVTLRRHALCYLINRRRWQCVSMQLAQQQLPAPKILDEYHVIGSAVRLDEIPPEYRKLPLLGRGATTIAFEKTPETVVIFTRDRMKVDWLIHGLHLVISNTVVNPVKSHHIRGMQKLDLEMIEMPKLYSLSPENRKKVVQEMKSWSNIFFNARAAAGFKNQQQLISTLATEYEEHHPNSLITPLILWLMNYDPGQYEFDLGTRQFKQTASGKIVLLDPIVSSELMKLFTQNKSPVQNYRQS